MAKKTKDQLRKEQAARRKERDKRDKAGAPAAAALTPEQLREKNMQTLFGQDVGAAETFGKELGGKVTGVIKQDLTPQVSGLLNSFQQIAQNDPRSAAMSQVLQKYQAGLGGYSSEESQAMREAASRGVDAQYENQADRLRKTQARSGVRGASAAAQQAALGKERGMAQAQMEQDLFIKNADEQQNRLKNYGGFLSGQEQTEFQNKNIALGNYGEMLGQALGRQDLQNSLSYQGMLGGLAQQYANKQLDETKRYQDAAINRMKR